MSPHRGIEQDRNKMAHHIYQITGLDDRERGFTRQVELSEQGGTFLAVFRYEKNRVEIEGQDSEASSLVALISQLQGQGYTQLQTRLLFKQETYLGTQELWTIYPDPDQPEEKPEGWWKNLIRKWSSKHPDNTPDPPSWKAPSPDC